MDRAVWSLNHGIPAARLATELELTEAQAEAVYQDIRNKRRTTRYLHLAPQLVRDVEWND
jgi:NAD+ synthase